MPSEHFTGLTGFNQVMLWILVALVVVCASALAAIGTVHCCHKLARCLLGAEIDEIPNYNSRVLKLKSGTQQECEVQMCNIAQVEQPAGEVVLGIPTEVIASSSSNDPKKEMDQNV